MFGHLKATRQSDQAISDAVALPLLLGQHMVGMEGAAAKDRDGMKMVTRVNKYLKHPTPRIASHKTHGLHKYKYTEEGGYSDEQIVDR